MTSAPLTRRNMLGLALASGAFNLLPALAHAQAAGTAAGTARLGDAEPFSFDALTEVARGLAQQPFTPMNVADAATLEQIDYDRHNEIRFRKEQALWAGDNRFSPVQFFFPGRYFKEPVHVYTVDAGMAREVTFSKDFFEIPSDNPAQALSGTEGFAGFSVQDMGARRDWMAFLGASYWRTEGYSGQFGLSVRGLALDTAIAEGGEEFPRFTRFWLEPQEGGDLVVNALLESPRATGAYRIASTRSDGIVQDVTARVFLRGDVTRLGLAPLTSMYWFGKHDHHNAPDWRPEVHDSDGLEILTAGGERIWRPLNNPPRTMANSFEAASLQGFGLMQRERDFNQYQDDGVFYERRASAWIEPKGDWGAGAVTLIEIPTDDEIHDNIVALWTPGRAATSGARFDVDYRLHWVRDTPVTPRFAQFTAMRIGAGGIPGQPRPEGVVKIVCDFAGAGLEGHTRAAGLSPRVDSNIGGIGNQAAYPVVGTDGWRAMFDLDFSHLDPGDDAPIDLRFYVDDNGTPLTETCIVQLFPSQLRRLLDERA